MATGAAKVEVVVADSDRTVLELLEIRLQVSGYRAVPARGAAAALDAFETARPAALIVDAKLTDADGVRVLDKLKGPDGKLPCPTLVTGHKLSSEDIDLALAAGAQDCIAKPFSGAEVLERIGRIMREPDEAAPAHVVEARCIDQKQLHDKYDHETAEHRRIVFERGSGMCPTWRPFRQFLADLGPAPSRDHLATRLAAGDLTYAPGKVTWIHRDRQPRLSEPWGAITANPAAEVTKWTTVRGQRVDHHTLATRLRLPVEGVDMALKGQTAADELVEQASIAEALSQDDADWLQPERRASFMAGYRMWHTQVKPQHAAAATPAFFYLFIALPGMLKLRDDLMAAGLWGEACETRQAERDAHPLWPRFQDALMRVDAARQDIAHYRMLNLSTQLDALWTRVRTMEARFRKGVG